MRTGASGRCCQQQSCLPEWRSDVSLVVAKVGERPRNLRVTWPSPGDCFYVQIRCQATRYNKCKQGVSGSKLEGENKKSCLWVNCSPHSIVWFVRKLDGGTCVSIVTFSKAEDQAYDVGSRIPSVCSEINAVRSLTMMLVIQIRFRELGCSLVQDCTRHPKGHQDR